MAAKQQLFDAGFIVRTPGALRAMRRAGVSEWSLLERHQSGDFGDIGAVLRCSNRRALRCKGRVYSAYVIRGRQAVWVITELGRRTTTVSTPADGTLISRKP